MSGPIGAARLAWRSATTTPAVSVLVVLVVALVSFAGTAAPGLLQAAQTTMVRHALLGDLPSQRDFSDALRGMPSVGSGGSDAAADLPEELRGTWGRSVDQLSAIGLLMEPRLAAVVGYPRTTVRLDVARATPDRDDAPLTRVILTLDPRLDERIELVDGTAPSAVVPGEPIDIMLIERIAEQTEWRIGEVRTLMYPIVGEVPVRLSGIARALDEGDPAWSHVPTSLHADVKDDGLSPPEYTGVAFADAGSLRAFTPLAGSAFVDAWFPLDVDRIDATGAAELVTEMRRFGTAALGFPVSTDGQSAYEVRAVFASVSASTLANADERAAGVAAVIAVAASGPVAVAIVVLMLASRLLAVRRRTTVTLAAARGASRTRISALLALEGLALGVVGAVLGSVVGLLVGQGTGPLVVIAPLLAALVPALALPVLGLTLAGRRGRVEEAGRRGGAWRPVAELAVVALAAASVILALTTAPEGQGATPLLVLLPVLLAAAGCVVALRLTPVLLRVVGRGARNARGLVPLLGPARAERDPAVGVAPVLAIVVGTAIAVFSSGFLATVSSGTDAAARAEIGADIRVTYPYFTEDILEAIDALDGVAASAPVYAEVRTIVEFPRTDSKVTVFVVDADELREVQGDRVGAFPVDGLSGGSGGVVPVVASDAVVELADGAAFEVGDASVEVVDTVVGRSPFGPAGLWIAIDRAHAERFVSPTFSPATVLVAVADGASVGAVRTSLTDLLGAGSATTIPQDLAAGHHADPGSGTLTAGLFSAIGTVAVLLAIAIALTLVLSSAARGRLFALLGALGLPRRQELSLVAWELAPVIVVAVPVGALLGVALVPVVSSALDLTVFTGGAVAPAIDFGGATTVALVLLFLAVALAAVTAAYLFARRTNAARTLRTIDEEG